MRGYIPTLACSKGRLTERQREWLAGERERERVSERERQRQRVS